MSAPVIPNGTLLESRGLTKQFGGVSALVDLDISIKRGQILGLIGPNGSGKTTFFNVVTGIYPATAGEVSFEGRDITKLSPQAIHRAGVSRTFQRSRLFLTLSVFDNLMVGNHTQLSSGLFFNVFCRSKLRRELSAARDKAHELVVVFSPALADGLFEVAGRFSMIDRRRIEICRALISRPKLLLLDEPSAGMTHEETSRLMDDILEMKERLENLTIVMIEHEMSVIERITDWCVVLNFGEKISEGLYQDVAVDRLVQDAYLGVS